jgi:hypothetical protein
MMIDQLIAFDGPPGTGKTRRIVEEASKLDAQGKRIAIVTYTKDAAAVVRSRLPDVESGTVYSLTWDYVKPFVVGKSTVVRAARNYSKRRIHHVADPALEQYRLDAPSMRPPHRLDEVAKRLHAWSIGPPPIDLDAEQAEAQLKFVLPLSKWLRAGAPIPRSRKYDVVFIDESQDMSWVELRAAAALIHGGGELRAFGDPGQAIFAGSKGVLGSSLPPVWQAAQDFHVLDKGYRVGNPVASVAASVLRSWYDRPASMFEAGHRTELLTWDGKQPPRTGLVLGYSRNAVFKGFVTWGLNRTGVVPKVAAADRELVLSTGHAAKGAEANEVYLLPWSRIAMNRFEQRDPATLRLLYVMLTRAKKRVYAPPQLRARMI